jgi:hypothetical protein
MFLPAKAGTRPTHVERVAFALTFDTDRLMRYDCKIDICLEDICKQDSSDVCLKTEKYLCLFDSCIQLQL